MMKLKLVNTPTPKKFLDDVCIIRIILIFMLIVYHSLCPYIGAWYNPLGFDIPVYKWLCRLTYSCMLETFVFISGLLLGFQVLNKGREALSFRHLVAGKAKRLLLPSIIFSTLYFVIFRYYTQPGTALDVANGIAEGLGHIWFLPMLFWCFLAMWVLGLIRCDKRPLIYLTFIVSVFSTVFSLPVRLNNSLYYFFFFFSGYCIGLKTIDLRRYFTKKAVDVAAVSFVAAFAIIAPVCYGYVGDIYGFVGKSGMPARLLPVFFAAVPMLLQLIYATLGVLFMYLAVNYLLASNAIKAGPVAVKFSSYCFGVYICQQFILQYLYYTLEAILHFNQYLLPLFAIVVTLVISVLLTHLMLKTKAGRFLIG